MKAIPTTYKGVRMRSRLEAEVALLLDTTGIRWTYEPESFLLADGVHYWPDFRCDDVRLWVESRGYRTPKGERQIEGFIALLASRASEDEPAYDYLLVRPQSCDLYEAERGFGTLGSRALLCACRSCNRWFFIGESGSFACRRCGEHDGDGHLIDMHDLVVRAGHLMLVDALGMTTTAAEFADELHRHAA